MAWFRLKITSCLASRHPEKLSAKLYPIISNTFLIYIYYMDCINKIYTKIQAPNTYPNSCTCSSQSAKVLNTEPCQEMIRCYQTLLMVFQGIFANNTLISLGVFHSVFIVCLTGLA
jgi:hypothetical protein